MKQVGIARFVVFASSCAIFAFYSFVCAQSQPPADALARYQAAATREAELDRQIADLTARLAAFEARARANTIIPPANNSAEAREAALRVVRPDMHPLDPGNLRYGTTFVFACAPNGRGSFTAYGLTATHVLYRPEDNFIDTGGAYNVNARNAEKKGVLSYGYWVLAEMGKDFEVRNQNDPLI